MILVSPEYFEIQYDAGMSLEIHEREGITEAELIMTTLFACRNLKKHVHVGSDLCQFGIASINHASEWCEVDTNSKSKRGLFKFHYGSTVSVKISDVNEPDKTTIRIKPDKTIFGEIGYTYEGIVSQAEILSAKLDGIVIKVEKI